MLLREFPLRGAARLLWSMEGGGCFWGSSVESWKEAVSRGAPAARGCSIEGEKKLLLGKRPLRGAARWREG